MPWSANSGRCDPVALLLTPARRSDCRSTACRLCSSGSCRFGKSTRSHPCTCGCEGEREEKKGAIVWCQRHCLRARRQCLAFACSHVPLFHLLKVASPRTSVDLGVVWVAEELGSVWVQLRRRKEGKQSAWAGHPHALRRLPPRLTSPPSSPACTLILVKSPSPTTWMYSDVLMNWAEWIASAGKALVPNPVLVQ